jgi:hypothetical protein
MHRQPKPKPLLRKHLLILAIDPMLAVSVSRNDRSDLTFNLKEGTWSCAQGSFPIGKVRSLNVDSIISTVAVGVYDRTNDEHMSSLVSDVASITARKFGHVRDVSGDE